MTTHSGPIVATKGSLTAIECSHCGFIHLDPIPTELPYASGHYHRDVKPDYRKEYDEDAEWWRCVYQDWMDLVNRHAPDINMLDVGAGTGHFTDFANWYGFLTTGIEPDKNMVGDDQFVVCSEYARWTNGRYGVISAHWVMEHLPNPKHFLQWARDRLVDDGLLLITIPNDFSDLQQRVMGEALLSIPSYYWLNEHHINYWNDESFIFLLESNGYELLEVYGSWEPELHLLTGHNYLKDHILGRELHRERMLADLNLTREERLEKYLKLGREGRGRDLTFLARKLDQ